MATLEEIMKKHNYSPSQVSLDGGRPVEPDTKQRLRELDMLDKGIDYTQPQKNNPAKDYGIFSGGAVGGLPQVLSKASSFTGGDRIGKGITTNIVNKLEDTKGFNDYVNQNNQNLVNAAMKIYQEKKAKGEDTSHIVKTLGDLGANIQNWGDNAENLVNPEHITGKQLAGDAVQLATTFATAGSLPGSAGVAPATNATSILSKEGLKTIGKQAVKQGVKGAVIGAGTGGAEGFAQGLKGDMSIQDSLSNALDSAETGAKWGAVIGSATGVAQGAKAINANKATLKFLDSVTLNANELSGNEYEKLLKQGRIQPASGTSPAKVILTDTEKQTALKYKDLLKGNLETKVKNVISEIGNQDQKVGEYLRQNNAIFNSKQLKSHLVNSLSDITDISVDEGRLNKAKQTLVDNFLKSVDTKNMEGLWQARKNFDGQIQKAFSGSPTLQKEMQKGLRNAVQEFISSHTDDVTYKGYMKEMSNLFDLTDTLVTKGSKVKNYSKLDLFKKNNPELVKTLGWIIGGTAVGKGISSIGD